MQCNRHIFLLIKRFSPNSCCEVNPEVMRIPCWHQSIAIDTEDLGELNTVEYVERAQIGDTIKVCCLKEDSDISNGAIAVYEIIPLEENK